MCPRGLIGPPAVTLSKILLLTCIHHFKSDLSNDMDHIRIPGTEPSSVTLIQRKWKTFWKVKMKNFAAQVQGICNVVTVTVIVPIKNLGQCRSFVLDVSLNKYISDQCYSRSQCMLMQRNVSKISAGI